MRGGGERIALGIFAGKDIIDTLVLIKSKENNAILAEFSVESSNNTAWGTTDGLIEGHADKIIQYLTDGKNQNI